MLFSLIVFFVLLLTPGSATVDITLPQYQYLSNHLSFDECIFLIEELFKIDSNIPENLPCLELLLFWNGSPGEGLGETHQLVCECLNQIERPDLSMWLSKSVFEQLQLSHNKSIRKDKEPLKTDKVTFSEEDALEDDTSNVPYEEWSALDIVGFITMFICLLVGLALCTAALVPMGKERRKHLDARLLGQNNKYSYKYIDRSIKLTV